MAISVAVNGHERKDSGVGHMPTIFVTGAPSKPCFTETALFDLSLVDPSRLSLSVLLRVVQDSQSIDFLIQVDASNEETFSEVEGQLKRLRNKLNVSGNANSKCMMILSGGNQRKKERPLSCDGHLTEALEDYQSGGFTTFVIEETIEKYPAASVSLQQTLRNRLVEKRIRGKYNESDFIPTESIVGILSEENIRRLAHGDEELRTCAREKLNAHISQIYRECQKLLAAILLADINPFGSLLLKFIDNAQVDRFLPFDPDRCPSFCKSERHQYEKICKYQWQVVPLDLKPYDNGRSARNRFRKECIIPFTEMERLNEGGFGDVFKVKVHPDYQKFPVITGKENLWFALKRFRRASEKSIMDFNRELDALKHVSGQKSPHLMQLLTAFQHGDDFLLFFPLAQCSLKDCFKNGDHTGDLAYFKWTMEQLLGLAEGIHAIHGDAEKASTHLAVQPPTEDKIGYHHDLKPDNILLWRDSGLAAIPFSNLEKRHGRLQISDFGLGRFREAATGSVSFNVKGTPTYAAPESKTQRSQSRPYDIWSFACIVIETLVWLLEGPEGLDNFIDQRDTRIKSTEENFTTDCYWLQRETTIIINPAVREQIRNIQNQKIFPELRGVIKQLTNIALHCLAIDTKRRPKAKQLCENMREVYKAMADTTRLPC